MKEHAHFSIGIDLGTTHCVLSYIDNHREDCPTNVMLIPQMTAPGTVQEQNQLASFVYQPHENEMSISSRILPWAENPKALVGAIARNLGGKTPIRLVSSAKSWLCHGGVNRRDPFLPVGSPDDVEKISPLHATELFLEHLKSAWNHQNPDYPIECQDVTVTIPASFDPAAREFTAEAAKNVGLNQLTLLEEPQAALYSWIEKNKDQWRETLNVGDTVLVVDIGGGTTDLSLVDVSEEDGNLVLNRIAVGEHILLGGDNMDLALAYRLKMKLSQQGKDLQNWQIQAITHACRDAKEKILIDNNTASVPIIVPSRGSKLLGSTLKVELTREEVLQTLVDGFFPKVSVNEHPIQRSRGALTQLGLPYAHDAAITKHIAGFLTKQRKNNTAIPFDGLPRMESQAEYSDFIKPTALLLNGGVLKSKLLTNRLIETLNSWLEQAQAPLLKLLQGNDLDLAVSSGASYYGNVRNGKGVRIRGGLASSYYVGIESALPAIPGFSPPVEAICVAPFGMEEDTSTHIDSRQFGLVVGQPVHFQFFGSTIRKDDTAGVHLEQWKEDELVELPEIQITLSANEGRRVGDVVPVTLASRVTEIGTLYLEAVAVDNGQTWHVEFDVRDNG